MIDKTYKELIQEFHYFKEEAKLDSKSIEKIDRLENILINTMKYYSSIDNKYVKEVNDDIIKKITSGLNACRINKENIISRMENYSLNFGNTKLDEIEYRIEAYNNLFRDLLSMYNDIVAKETNYDINDMIKLYDECVASINSKKGNIEFLGEKLSEYSPSKYQNKLISKLYFYISDKTFISTFSDIVKIKNEINDDVKEIRKLEFIKANKRHIEGYDEMTNSSNKDLNYIIEKSYVCDELNSKLKERKRNRLLKKSLFDIFYSNLTKQIKAEENSINRRHNEYKKKEEYLSKVTAYFSKHGYKMEAVINYLWLDNEMIENKINNYKYEILDKQATLEELVAQLSSEDEQLYEDNYSTIENIIGNLCNTPSNMINIYILYLLSNLDSIINDNKKECYDDFKTNDIVAKYRNECIDRINEIDTYKGKQKIKTR